MIQLLEFYSLHLILYSKLVSISLSIPSSAFLSHSYAVRMSKLSSMSKYLYAFLGSSSLMSFSNVLPTCVLLWILPLFKHILAHFSKPKFIFISLLIVYTIFISFFKSFSFLLSSFKSSIYNKWLIFLSVIIFIIIIIIIIINITIG